MSDTTDTTSTDTTSTDAGDQTSTAQTTNADQTTTTDTGDGKDWQQEAEKWKALARKHEGASKANADKAKQFDELTEAQKTELQKAIDKAEAAEKRAAELEAKSVRSDVAAAKGVPANLLSGTTQEELEASADALLAFRGEKPKPDFGGGDRGGDVGSKKGQLTHEDVKRMTPQEITQARKDGRLEDLLAGKGN